MGEVVNLNCRTTLDLPVDRILEGGTKAKLTDAILIGYTEDGKFYFSSSNANAPEILWALEEAKRNLLDISDDDY